MELSLLESCIYGLLNGLLDILPVSGQAHSLLLLKFFGVKASSDVMELLIHLAVFAALYSGTRKHWVRMQRARALARIPQRKRKRPLDVRSMMDWSLLKTMLVPALIGVFLRQFTEGVGAKLSLIALFLFLNGVIVYAPQFFPTGNRDSRTLSRVEGLLMGLGGMISAVPGLSAMGAATAIGSVCGVERTYGLDMALMMNMGIVAGSMVYDVLGIVANGFGGFSLGIVLAYVISAACAYGGAVLGIRWMRRQAQGRGYAGFGVYCWGMALFTFILNLIA